MVLGMTKLNRDYLFSDGSWRKGDVCVRQIYKKNKEHVWFLFLKTVFCSQKQEEQRKHREHVWFKFFCYVRENQNGVLCVFKNYSREQF